MASCFFEGLQIPKKDSKRLRVTPSQKVVTYCEAAFLKGPKSPKKASKRFLVARSQKVPSLASNSHTGKPLSRSAPNHEKSPPPEHTYIPGWREPGAARKDGENIRGTCCALGCVGGSLAEAQRGTEMPREAERGPESLREAQAKRWPVFVALWPRLTYTYIHTYIGPFKKRLPKM